VSRYSWLKANYSESKRVRTGESCNGPDHSSRYLNHGKFSNHVRSSGNDIHMMHFRCAATVTHVVSCITIFSTSMMYVWSSNLYPGLLEMSVGAVEQGDRPLCPNGFKLYISYGSVGSVHSIIIIVPNDP